MSFQIKDRKKIQLFRKCVQLLTNAKEEFQIHFNKTHIRLFNVFQDDVTYMFDLQASWFSKFVAPECILNDEVEILQVKCHRELFLQGFNILDDTELEFLIHFDSQENGMFKVIKTREFFIVEANVPFEIQRDVSCDENYEFPDSQLLLDGEVKYLKNLRGIFKSKCKSEIMDLNFNDDVLAFKGEINNKFGYEIKTQNLTHYGNYLSADQEKANSFQIALSLRHILGLLKIAEMIEGNFMAAMELLDTETCVTFLFTHSHERKDFKFCIGIGNVRFTRMDGGAATAGMGASSMANNNQRLKKQVPQGNVRKASDQVDAPGIKVEESATTGALSTTNFQNQFMHQQAIPAAKKGAGEAQKKAGKQADVKIEQNEQDDDDQQMEVDVDAPVPQEEEDDEPAPVQTKKKPAAQQKKVIKQLPAKRDRRAGGAGRRKGTDESGDVGMEDEEEGENEQTNNDEDMEDQVALEAKKMDFYKQVDNEEFF